MPSLTELTPLERSAYDKLSPLKRQQIVSLLEAGKLHVVRDLLHVPAQHLSHDDHMRALLSVASDLLDLTTKKLNSHAHYLQSHDGHIVSLKSDSQAHGSQIASLKSDSQAQGGQIGSLKSGLQDQGSQIASLKSDSQAQGGQIDSLESDSQVQGSQIGTLLGVVRNLLLLTTETYDSQDLDSQRHSLECELQKDSGDQGDQIDTLPTLLLGSGVFETKEGCLAMCKYLESRNIPGFNSDNCEATCL